MNAILRLRDRESYEPINKTETMMLRGENSVIAADSAVISRKTLQIVFTAKANLSTLLNSPGRANDEIMREAQLALQRIASRSNENAHGWAAKLSNDLGSFQD